MANRGIVAAYAVVRSFQIGLMKSGSLGARTAIRRPMKISKTNTKGTFPELRGSLAGMRYPCFGEIKYDGEAVFVHFKNVGGSLNLRCVTTNKYGTMRYEWDKLYDIAHILKYHNVHIALMQGELFYGTGKAGALYDLLSHKTDDDLNIKLFDIDYLKMEDGTTMEGAKTALIDRKEYLTSFFSNTEFEVIPVVISSKQEAEKHFEDMTTLGYEGIVLKQLDGFACKGPCPWVKMKKKDQNVYMVNLVDPVKERIEVLCPVVGQNNISIRVGVKVANKDKIKMKVGDKVIVEHQGVLGSGSLRHPVFIGWYKGDENGGA